MFDQVKKIALSSKPINCCFDLLAKKNIEK